jgi:DNA-binding beta-propeller fold protein YncE
MRRFLIPLMMLLPVAAHALEPAPVHLRDIVGFDRVHQMARRDDGRIYVADGYHHRVVVFSAEGRYLEQIGSMGSALGQFRVPGGLAFGADGSLFVTHQLGDRITKFSPTHLPLLSFGSTGTEPGQLRAPSNLALSPDGSRLYVTELAGNRVSVFDPDGNFLFGFGSAGSGAGQFSSPFGIAVNGAGEVFVADQANHRVQRFDADGNYLSQWGTHGSAPGQFDLNPGLGFDQDGHLYVTDQLNNRVQKFDHDGTLLGLWGSLGDGPGEFYNPWAVLPLPGGEIWVADTYNYRISIFGPGTTALASGEVPGPQQEGRALPMSGLESTAPSRVIAAPCEAPVPEPLQDLYGFDRVHQMARRDDGRIYVADGYHHRIVVFSAAGLYLEQMGAFGTSLGEFNVTGGLAFGADGSLYVTHQLGDRITRFSPTHLPLASFGSSGTGPGQLRGPSNLAMSPDGNRLYVAELIGDRVSMFDADGNPQGSFGTSGSGPGQFDSPFGIAVNDAGEVFVSDQSNHRIERFDDDGTFLSQWGTFGTGPGEFHNVVGIGFDSAGDLYAADQLNNRVQKLRQDGSPLQQWGTFGTGPGQFYNPWAVLPLPDGEIWVGDTFNHRISIFGPGQSLSPRIAGITDIPGDDGFQVRIRFFPSALDVAGSPTPILQYEAYRRIDAAPAAAGAINGPATTTRPVSPNAEEIGSDRVLLAGWEFVGAVPAHGESEYNMVVPTLVNSTRHRARPTTFFLRASTSQPTLFHDSCPDSGASVDNHRPGAPQNFSITGTQSDGAPLLSWSACEDPDFMSYALYRGTAADFEPSEANRVADLSVPGFVDQAAAGIPGALYYKLSSMDQAENESDFAVASTEALLGVLDGLPSSFALLPCRPNPVVDRASFQFDLPHASEASLVLFDVHGRLVRVLGTKVPLQAGRHRWEWDRRDQGGVRAPAGVYFFRLTTPGFSQTRRAVVSG